jgi:hypothetical protein
MHYRFPSQNPIQAEGVTRAFTMRGPGTNATELARRLRANGNQALVSGRVSTKLVS